jgi:hypothetical protein
MALDSAGRQFPYVIMEIIGLGAKDRISLDAENRENK